MNIGVDAAALGMANAVVASLTMSIQDIGTRRTDPSGRPPDFFDAQLLCQYRKYDYIMAYR
jgi:hypothetical protein